MTRAFDSWRSVALSLYMVLTGYAVLVGLPVISTAWVTRVGFDEAQVGWLSAADLGGLSLGAVLCACVIARANRRHLVIGAALAAVAANLGCVFTVDFGPVLALRAVAGLASGVYTGVAVASLGAHSNPTRAFSWALFAFAFSQALELYLLPKLSIGAIYTVFAVGYALTLAFVRWLPARAEPAPEAEAPRAARSVPAYVPWLVLAAIGFTYISIGAYWTYIELASRDAQASAEWVGQVLVWSALCSIAGCVAAGVISRRFGLARPLIVTLAAQALVVALLVGGVDDTRFMVSVFGFNFLWMLSDIYQLSTVAGVDASGRFAALVPGAQGLGQIVGPGIGAGLLGAGFGYSSVFVLCAVASLLAMALHLGMALRRARAERDPRRSPLESEAPAA